MTWGERAARRAEVLRGFGEGVSVVDLARKSGLTLSTVYAICRGSLSVEAGVWTPRHEADERRRAKTASRNAEMRKKRAGGMSLGAISREYGVTRARVFQIVGSGDGLPSNPDWLVEAARVLWVAGLSLREIGVRLSMPGEPISKARVQWMAKRHGFPERVA